MTSHLSTTKTEHSRNIKLVKFESLEQFKAKKIKMIKFLQSATPSSNQPERASTSRNSPINIKIKWLGKSDVKQFKIFKVSPTKSSTPIKNTIHARVHSLSKFHEPNWINKYQIAKKLQNNKLLAIRTSDGYSVVIAKAAKGKTPYQLCKQIECPYIAKW